MTLLFDVFLDLRASAEDVSAEVPSVSHVAGEVRKTEHRERKWHGESDHNCSVIHTARPC